MADTKNQRRWGRELVILILLVCIAGVGVHIYDKQQEIALDKIDARVLANSILNYHSQRIATLEKEVGDLNALRIPTTLTSQERVITALQSDVLQENTLVHLLNLQVNKMAKMLQQILDTDENALSQSQGNDAPRPSHSNAPVTSPGNIDNAPPPAFRINPTAKSP